MNTIRIYALFSLVFSVLLLAGLSSCTDTAENKKENIILVEAGDDFDSNKIVVKWAGKDKKFITAFEGGKDLMVIAPKSTEDNFDIYYDGDIVAGAGIRRSDESNAHTFKIGIFSENKTPYIDFHPYGPDSLSGFYIKKYVRDMQGNVSREEYFNEFGQMTIQDYTNLDVQGNVVNTNRFVFQYDDKGQKIRQEHNSWDPNGKLLLRMVNTLRYNAMGLKEEMTYDSFKPDGSFKEANTNIYKYNEDGKEIERTFISFNEDRSVNQYFITLTGYDEYGRGITETLLDRDKVRMNELTRHYNENGFIVHEEMITFKPDGSVDETHGAHYDEKGVVLKDY